MAGGARYNKTRYMSWRMNDEQYRIVERVARLLEGNHSMALRFIIRDFARRHGMLDDDDLDFDLDLDISSEEENGTQHEALV